MNSEILVKHNHDRNVACRKVSFAMTILCSQLFLSLGIVYIILISEEADWVKTQCHVNSTQVYTSDVCSDNSYCFLVYTATWNVSYFNELIGDDMMGIISESFSRREYADTEILKRDIGGEYECYYNDSEFSVLVWFVDTMRSNNVGIMTLCIGAITTVLITMVVANWKDYRKVVGC